MRRLHGPQLCFGLGFGQVAVARFRQPNGCAPPQGISSRPRQRWRERQGASAVVALGDGPNRLAQLNREIAELAASRAQFAETADALPGRPPAASRRCPPRSPAGRPGGRGVLVAKRQAVRRDQGDRGSARACRPRPGVDRPGPRHRGVDAAGRLPERTVSLQRLRSEIDNIKATQAGPRVCPACGPTDPADQEDAQPPTDGGWVADQLIPVQAGDPDPPATARGAAALTWSWSWLSGSWCSPPIPRRPPHQLPLLHLPSRRRRPSLARLPPRQSGPAGFSDPLRPHLSDYSRMKTLDPARLLVAFRLHAAVRDRVHLKKLAGLLGRVQDALVRAGIESGEFGELVTADDRLRTVRDEYLARPKGAFRVALSMSGGLAGSIDEARRALAAGTEPPEDFNGSLGPDPLGPTAAPP